VPLTPCRLAIEDLYKGSLSKKQRFVGRTAALGLQHNGTRSNRPDGSGKDGPTCPVRKTFGATRTTYPEPRVIQLPATTHFFGSESDCVTGICDTGAPTAEQDDPR
jgi:hypothetical protein